MAIYQPSKDVLLAAVNSQNSLSVKMTDIVWSAPKDIRGTEKETTTQRNTMVKITADGVTGSTWSGKKNLYYNRMKVEDLAIILGDTLAIGPSNAKLHTALVGLNQRYGFALEEGDWLDADIEWNGDKTAGTVKVTADPESIGWIGQYTFKVVKGDESLVSSVTTSVLTGLKYPNGQMGSETVSAIIAPVYSYPYNFTKYRDALLAFTPGVLSGQPLTDMVNLLKDITGTAWVATTAASYGLAGAEVVSVGLNDPVAMPTNAKYKYALALKLPATCTSIVGTLYLQFNDLDDPSEV
ncbi:virion structural protein [Erwinia phage vB_EamM_Caitlin]|uniref:virion structural protein n=1 Tax=Erwinia phage vB_EamM_Caitlin TaxID=1883379 RepID=UPI00081C9CCA|nr:virion structural protein [Erwinia phage vB_EamM_Caitlin]ANZ48447.1 putative virion structural protein [Erwinia phage vB_EamM_Caitlin]